jgi:hypothetical protein
MSRLTYIPKFQQLLGNQETTVLNHRQPQLDSGLYNCANENSSQQVSLGFFGGDGALTTPKPSANTSMK